VALRLSASDAKRLGIAGHKAKTAKKPTKGGLAAEAVIDWCKRNGYPVPKTEYRFAFAIGREWRFDLAFPMLAEPLAVEINGGGWVSGRHNRGSSLEAEYEKLSNAAVLGWRVILATYAQLKRGELWGWLEAALADRKEAA